MGDGRREEGVNMDDIGLLFRPDEEKDRFRIKADLRNTGA